MPKRKTFKRIFAISMLSLLTLYFSSHAIIGPRGLINLIELNKNLQNSSQELSSLIAYKDAIESKVQGLNEKNLDVDLLDEQVRNVLGYADRNEVVIYNNEY